MWTILGIPPTSEPLVIRRAYVALLRRLDVDREPDAFIRLREAYEQALVACAVGDRNGGQPTAVDRGPDFQSTVLADPVGGSETNAEPAERDPAEWIATTLANGTLAEAWQVYNHGLASGAIGIDQQRPLAARLASAALHDAGVPTDTFAALAAQLGPEDAAPDWLTPLRSEATRRIEAHRWLDRVTIAASRPPSGTSKYTVRAAMTLLGRRRRIARSWKDLDALRHLLDEYRRHASWLDGRVDADRLRLLEERLGLAIARQRHRDRLFIGAVVAFFVLDFLYVFLFGEW